MNDQRVLVTGGLGFIGVPVVETLLDRGASVRVVDDESNATSERLPEGATHDRVDIRTPAVDDVIDAFAPTAIVHLAAIHYIPECNADPERTFEVNVMGTRRILWGLRGRSDLETVVFGSSAAVYPPTPGPVDEGCAPGPIDIYGRTKLVGEDLSRLFHADTGVATGVARLFNVYGPGETNPHLIPAIVEQVGTATTVELGNLEPRRDFVYVQDAADALVEMLDETTGFSTYNVGTGEARSVREVANAVGRALDRDLTVDQANTRIRETDRHHLQADPSLIQSELGWEPTVSFEEGLRAVLRDAGALR